MGPFLRPTINLEPTEGECLRTLPELVNFHSLHNPDHLFCLQAEENGNADGYIFTEIRYGQLREAIVRCQGWLEDCLKETEPPIRNEDGTFTKSSPVALFMESNVGMTVYVLSLIGLGMPVVLLSTRLSPLSVGHLLRETNAQAVLVSPRLRSVVSEALASGADLEPGKDKSFCVSKIKIAKALLTVPSILEEIALLPDQRGINALRKLDFVAFGGGIPKESITQTLSSAGVRLINHYGATETGPLTPFFQPSPSHDWRFFQLRTDIIEPLKVQLDPLDEPDRQGSTFKLSMQPFGWNERYELQDMLIRNPDGSGNSFTAAGRTDDLICLATGEKVRPTILEDLLQQNEGVKAATAFGNNQFELGVVVEPMASLTPSEHNAFKASIWPAIEEAGRQMDAHGRISSQAAIIIVDRMALPRSDKGTVLRNEVYKSFAKEILDVYHELDVDAIAPPIDLTSPVSSIKSMITTMLPRSVVNDDWSEEKDLFGLGMDSLQATRLRRLLAGSLQATRIKAEGKGWLQLPTSISQDFVYRHPSAVKLAEALVGGQSQGDGVSDMATFDRILCETTGRVSDDQHSSTVLMTGSTGSLGSYLLYKLLESPGIKRVICLSRPSEEDPYSRQRHALRAKGIELPEDAWSRVLILQTSMNDTHLGLDENQYQELAMAVTHVIHAAWPMNFKLTLPSFKPIFQALRNLIQLCLQIHTKRSWRRPRFLFISSISTAGNYSKLFSERIVPEEKIADPQCALTIGYAQAKLMCEKIIERAAADNPQIEMGFVRLGQIAGALSGYWNANEHFVAIISSSKTLGVLPDLRELLFDTQLLRLVYHLENPIRQSWQDVTDVLTEELGIPRSKCRPLDHWVDLVRNSADAGNPAKSLATFLGEEFEKMSCGGVVLGTEVSRIRATTLRQTGPVSDTTIRAYVRYWKRVGAVSDTVLPDSHPS
ncbi:MAG: hypothetical protein Q9172_004957 [Xanthocarpia lactea]